MNREDSWVHSFWSQCGRVRIHELTRVPKDPGGQMSSRHWGGFCSVSHGPAGMPSNHQKLEQRRGLANTLVLDSGSRSVGRHAFCCSNLPYLWQPWKLIYSGSLSRKFDQILPARIHTRGAWSWKDSCFFSTHSSTGPHEGWWWLDGATGLPCQWRHHGRRQRRSRSDGTASLSWQSCRQALSQSNGWHTRVTVTL